MNIEMQRIEDYFQDLGLQVEEFTPLSSFRVPDEVIYTIEGEILQIGYKDARSHMFNESERDEVINDSYPFALGI